MNDLWHLFKKEALQVGFDDCGGVDYNQETQEKYQEHVSRYEKWIDEKNHASMVYLERGLERRRNPELFFPGLKSVATVLKKYSSQTEKTSWVKYANYIEDFDYHESVFQKLENIVEKLKVHHPQLKAKVCVDTSAVLERAWGQLTGLGWVGKNSMLLHPIHGSYFFLGVVFLSEPLQRSTKMMKDFCGHCSRCIRACPTNAILPKRTVESKKCISYQTLENRSFDDFIWENSKGYVAGCDLCQEVCPFNFKRMKKEEMQNRKVAVHDPESLFLESKEEYRKRVQHTSLSRVKYDFFRRNLLQNFYHYFQESIEIHEKNKWKKMILDYGEIFENDVGEIKSLKSKCVQKIDSL